MIINYKGEYRLRRTNWKHREPYWESTVRVGGNCRTVFDAAGRENGQDVVRLIPYGQNCDEIDKVLQTGDLLAYVQAPMNDINFPAHMDLAQPTATLPYIGKIKNILKGRATHAELGFKGSDPIEWVVICHCMGSADVTCHEEVCERDQRCEDEDCSDDFYLI